MRLRDAVQNRRLRVALWALVFILTVLLPAVITRGSDQDVLCNMAVNTAARNVDLVQETTTFEAAY